MCVVCMTFKMCTAIYTCHGGIFDLRWGNFWLESSFIDSSIGKWQSHQKGALSEAHTTLCGLTCMKVKIFSWASLKLWCTKSNIFKAMTTLIRRSIGHIAISNDAHIYIYQAHTTIHSVAFLISNNSWLSKSFIKSHVSPHDFTKANRQKKPCS